MHRWFRFGVVAVFAGAVVVAVGSTLAWTRVTTSIGDFDVAGTEGQGSLTLAVAMVLAALAGWMVLSDPQRWQAVLAGALGLVAVGLAVNALAGNGPSISRAGLVVTGSSVPAGPWVVFAGAGLAFVGAVTMSLALSRAAAQERDHPEMVPSPAFRLADEPLFELHHPEVGQAKTVAPEPGHPENRAGDDAEGTSSDEALQGGEPDDLVPVASSEQSTTYPVAALNDDIDLRSDTVGPIAEPPGGGSKAERSSLDTMVVAVPAAILEHADAAGRQHRHHVGPITTIGRSEECDLHLDDAFASKCHAAVRRGSEGWFVRDAGSTNGTLLNDELVDGSARLRAGDRIRVGHTDIIFREGT